MEEPTPDAEPSPETELRDRRCGRCQLVFPGEPGLHASAQLGWWLCPPCRDSLVGHQAAGRW